MAWTVGPDLPTTWGDERKNLRLHPHNSLVQVCAPATCRPGLSRKREEEPP